MTLLALLLAAASPVPAASAPATHAPAASGPSDTRSAKTRFDTCVHLSDADPAAAAQSATDWARQGGGVAAAQCLGIARSASGDWKGAVDAFSTAATLADQLHDPLAAANLWVSAGDAALAGGDPAKARTLLGTAVGSPALSPEMKGEAFLDRARACVAGDDLVAARGDMDEAVRLVPADPMAWLLSATLARRMKDVPRAQTDIKEALARAPDDADVLDEAGNIAAAGGDTAAARTQWVKALGSGADSDGARHARAQLVATGGIPASALHAGR